MHLKRCSGPSAHPRMQLFGLRGWFPVGVRRSKQRPPNQRARYSRKCHADRRAPGSDPKPLQEHQGGNMNLVDEEGGLKTRRGNADEDWGMTRERNGDLGIWKWWRTTTRTQARNTGNGRGRGLHARGRRSRTRGDAKENPNTRISKMRMLARVRRQTLPAIMRGSATLKNPPGRPPWYGACRSSVDTNRPIGTFD